MVALAAGGTIAISSIESIIGSAGNDVVQLRDNVTGLMADLGGGTDILNLAAGANTLAASGVETIVGSASADALTLTVQVTGATVDLQGGTDTLTLGDFANSLTAVGIESLIGGAGDDAVTLLGNLDGLNVTLGAGLYGESRWEWCAAYLATLMAGGIAVPIDAQLGPKEVSAILHDSEAVLIFHSDKTAPDTGDDIRKINFDGPLFREIGKTTGAGRYPGQSREALASILYTSGSDGQA